MAESSEFLPSLLDRISRLDEESRKAQAICDFINLTEFLDPDAIITIIAPKLESHFSLFDLFLHRAQRNAKSAGMLITLLDYASEFIEDLKNLLQACLEVKISDEDANEQNHIFIEKEIAQALGISHGYWKQKPVDLVEYDHPFLHSDNLFPKTTYFPMTKDESEENSVSFESGNDKSDSGEHSSNDVNYTPLEPKRRRGRPKKDLTGSQYRCNKCAKYFSKAYGKSHEKKCKGKDEGNKDYLQLPDGMLKCNVKNCTSTDTFSSIQGFQKHFKDCHRIESEKNYTCEYCHEGFTFKEEHYLHVTLNHLNSLACKWCGKLCANRSKLLEHVRVHTGEKPYRCLKCDYSCSKMFNLENHMAKKHNEKITKNAKCDTCEKEFTSVGRLNRHKRIYHAKNLERKEQMERKPKDIPENEQSPENERLETPVEQTPSLLNKPSASKGLLIYEIPEEEGLFTANQPENSNNQVEIDI